MAASECIINVPIRRNLQANYQLSQSYKLSFNIIELLPWPLLPMKLTTDKRRNMLTLISFNDCCWLDDRKRLLTYTKRKKW